MLDRFDEKVKKGRKREPCTDEAAFFCLREKGKKGLLIQPSGPAVKPEGPLPR